MSDYIDTFGVRRRSCCSTPYSETHRGDCPDRGVVARSWLACQITTDGWCAAHSTGDGPVYCQPVTQQETSA